MNKLFAIICLALLPIGALSQTYSGDTWATCQKNKKGEIAFVYINSPYVSEKINGTRKGICVDIMSEFVKFVSEEKGIDLKVKDIDAPNDFDKFLNAISKSTGGVFGLADVTITEERKKLLKFSPPYMDNFPVLITNSVIPKFQNEGDLFKNHQLKTVYTVKNSILEKRTLLLIEKFKLNVAIQYLPSSIEILEKVSNDRTGFALIDAIFYLDAIKELKPISPQLLKGDDFEEYGITMPKNSDWGPLMTEFFEREEGFTKSTRYKRILFENLGSTGVILFSKKSSKKESIKGS